MELVYNILKTHFPFDHHRCIAQNSRALFAIGFHYLTFPGGGHLSHRFPPAKLRTQQELCISFFHCAPDQLHSPIWPKKVEVVRELCHFKGILGVVHLESIPALEGVKVHRHGSSSAKHLLTTAIPPAIAGFFDR